jgi:hypothetical protein
MRHAWVYSHAAGNDHVWKCSQCPATVGFNKQGIGNPWASDTEHPENIDDYADPKECPDLAERVFTSDLVQILIKTVDIPAAVATGKITQEDADKLGLVRREEVVPPK